MRDKSWHADAKFSFFSFFFFAISVRRSSIFGYRKCLIKSFPSLLCSPRCCCDVLCNLVFRARERKGEIYAVRAVLSISSRLSSFPGYLQAVYLLLQSGPRCFAKSYRRDNWYISSFETDCEFELAFEFLSGIREMWNVIDVLKLINAMRYQKTISAKDR